MTPRSAKWWTATPAQNLVGAAVGLCVFTVACASSPRVTDDPTGARTEPRTTALRPRAPPIDPTPDRPIPPPPPTGPSSPPTDGPQVTPSPTAAVWLRSP